MGFLSVACDCRFAEILHCPHLLAICFSKGYLPGLTWRGHSAPKNAPLRDVGGLISKCGRLITHHSSLITDVNRRLRWSDLGMGVLIRRRLMRFLRAPISCPETYL